VDLLHDHSFVGHVLRTSALAEFDLDILLTVYFTRDDRSEEFLQSIIPNVTFDRKIQILEQLPLRKKLKTVSRVIPNLRRLKKIRNLVAHSAVISPKKVEKLFQDNEVARLLLDYPGSLEEISQQIRRDFLYLANLKEFRHKKDATNLNAADFGAYKFLEEMTDV
jgi:hypothetical protein